MKRLEFHANGNLLVAEFWPKWQQPGVVWPEDAYDPEDGEGAANGQ